MTDAEGRRHVPLRAADIWLLIGGGVALYAPLSVIGPGLSGPAYLGVFALIWALLMAAHVTLRHVWRDSFAVSGVAAAVLAGLAFSRYFWGVQRGMQRWTFLTIMAALGCASFFLRADYPSDHGGATWRRSLRRDGRARLWTGGCGSASGSCSSGGGGCGGGGCGGGGCGGCGGD